ncbi:MAG: elongation factor Ts [Deltaproteobacteria bacterium]|nr:elongation factor Ts [Deltaproteobacteria bacterium]MBU54491.1 elongation factor Ts [Deltaproteobacteria bacterium]|tara:strand:+ start:22550 stop:23209 length:660 start_codon:yes stop_codon:yes gene_type:complete
MSDVKITAKLVKQLRDKTGAGMMDCKKALKETNGNIEEAVDFLRKKGMASADKKSSRIASEGAVGSYIHMGGRIGVLVELNCETDFVARTDRFQELLTDIAMQIAATAPEYVTPEEIPADVLEREKGIFREQALQEGKPEKIVDKIVDGRVSKFYKQVCLLHQPFVKEDKKTVEEVIKEVVAEIGENIRVRRFARFVLGEGLEKREDDLAAEVAKAVGA